MTDADDLTKRTEDQPDTPAEPEPQAKPAAAKPRSVFLPLVLGGVIAAGLGFGAAQVVPQGWPFAPTNALAQQLAAQTDEITRLQTRLAALEGQTTPDFSPLMETLAALNARVAALETGPAERAEETAALTAAIAQVQSDLAALQASGPVPANITALAAQAEARLQEAEAEAAQLKAEAEALNAAAATRVALAALRAAVDTGAPYAAELAQLGRDAPEALAAHAETGAPSLTALQASFPEAARAALESALRADMGDSWADRATSFLRSQTGARSLTPREGSDPDAILSRAEAALATGNLTATLAELATLPEVALTAMADWRTAAEQRSAVLQALADLAANIGE